LEDFNASLTRLQAALKEQPDVFHYGGHALPQGLLLAYDVCITGGALNVRTADDLKGLPPRLVVLSGCGTPGPSVEDEGFVSMVRSFHDAKFPGVVGTLWETDDFTSALVIATFYRNLLTSPEADPGRALQEAMLWLKGASWQERMDRMREDREIGDTRPIPVPVRRAQRDYPSSNPEFWAGYVDYGA
jgi:CHAT domain-containing protein